MNLDVSRFLEDLTAYRARSYTDALGDLMVAITIKDRVQASAARHKLSGVISDTMGIAEVIGASLALEEAARMIDHGVTFKVPRRITLPRQTLVANVTFEESIQDMISRAPVTIRSAAERTAQRIAELYSRDRVAAFVRSAEHAVTRRAQVMITHAMAQGIPEREIGKSIVFSVDQVRRETAPWTEAYARMAFRTNVNTAVTAGRFRQVQDPAVRQVIPALRFDAIADRNTRSNHLAADGLIFSSTSPAWRLIAPPLGYNCRCRVAFVTVAQLSRMGRLDANGNVREDRVPRTAHADEGFRHGGRPDLFMVA